MMRWGLLGLLCCAAAPATAETLTVTGANPAEQPNVNDLVSLAVERFDGPDGAALAQAIEAELTAAQFDGRPYFRIIAPESGAPVDGLLTGTVRTSVEESTVLETRTNCIEHAPDGKKKCLKEAKANIRCRHRIASVTTSVRLVAMVEGDVRYTRSMQARDEQTYCPDRSASQTVEDFVQSSLRTQAQSVRHDLAPSEYATRIRVDESRKGLPEPAQDTFKQAVHLTKTDPVGACATWAALARDAPPTPALAFNLGLCAEVAHDYDAAIGWYHDAERLGSRGGDIPGALARIDGHRRALADWQDRKARLGYD